MDTDRMDSHLTEAVNASTTGHVVEWSQVVMNMRIKGHIVSGEEQYRKRMDHLVKRYLKALIECHSVYESACNEWPLFAYINDINLKPFFNDIDIINIDNLRLLLVKNMAEKVFKTSVARKTKTANAEGVTKTVDNKSMIEKSEEKAVCMSDIGSDTYSESVTNSYDSKQVLESSPPQKTYESSQLIINGEDKTDSTNITEPIDNSYDSQPEVNDSVIQKTNCNPSVELKFLVDFDGNKFFVTIDSLDTEYAIFDRIIDEIESAIGSTIGVNTHTFEVRLFAIVLTFDPNILIIGQLWSMY